MDVPARPLMPCNHCGLCCLIELCEIGQYIHGGPKRRRCPSLRWVGNGYTSRCGILEDAKEEFKAEIAWIIAADEGCGIDAEVTDIKGKVSDFKMLPDRMKVLIATEYRMNPVEVTTRGVTHENHLDPGRLRNLSQRAGRKEGNQH